MMISDNMMEIPMRTAKRKMNQLLLFFCLSLLVLDLTHASDQKINAENFAKLALNCVHKEYPNKISHTMQSDADVMPPRELYPSFFGCYDWHSSVHGHWLLTRLARLYPDSELAPKAISALGVSLSKENLLKESVYVSGKGRKAFERPYGIAWLLQLAAELDEWDYPRAKQWRTNIRPLEEVLVSRVVEWLPKLTYPVRSGQHAQTAFALGLMLDWARTTKNSDVESLIRNRILEFYVNDKKCPIHYEPSGADFLSPCLAEADLMRRVMSPSEFAVWLNDFLEIPNSNKAWLEPAIVSDRSDPKLAHIDGLNISRAWMLEGIASGLPPKDLRIKALRIAAEQHQESGLIGVNSEFYEGGHWLGSFATYLVTKRGIVTK